MNQAQATFERGQIVMVKSKGSWREGVVNSSNDRWTTVYVEGNVGQSDFLTKNVRAKAPAPAAEDFTAHAKVGSAWFK